MASYPDLALPPIISARKIKKTQDGLPAPEVLAEATEVFRLLANPVRLSLMHALSHDELTVGDIARALNLSLSATSHQLALLRRMRLVAIRDEGRLTYYRATDEFVGHLVHDCLAHVGQRLGRQGAPHHHSHRVSSRKKVARSIAIGIGLASALAASLVTAPLFAQAQKSTDTASTNAARKKEGSGPTPGIQDNSFLIEEAYNQEPGVVQHISSFVHDQRSASYAYQFTQEWPVGGISNQLSYSLAFLQADASSGAGIGDTRLNYRYQLVGDGEARVAVAPRLTSILPTGDYKRGRGAGALGVEVSLPVSVVLTSQLVAHGNVGLTLTPHARNTEGARATTSTWTSGGSLIWLARSSFNVMVETIFQRVEEVSSEGRVVRGSSATVSPGVRWAYNFPSGLQIVPGIALPLGVGRSAGERSVLLYLSFEHPFTRSAREKASGE